MEWERLPEKEVRIGRLGLASLFWTGLLEAPALGPGEE